MNFKVIEENINLLADFCGKRDIEELTKEELIKKINIEVVDAIVLFGGSVVEGCDIAAKAMLEGVAKNLVIVGGEGHTTETLREKIREQYPNIVTANKKEADIMGEYIELKYNIKDYYKETQSTNCGNNVTNTLELFKEKGLPLNNIIIIQDSAMQLRMDAGFKKYNPNINIINYAAYKVKVVAKDGRLTFEKNNVLGMWKVERYISLLMGEVPRLYDDKFGYGPNGSNFIAHVDVPKSVLGAFNNLKLEYDNLVRGANPLYASNNK